MRFPHTKPWLTGRGFVVVEVWVQMPTLARNPGVFAALPIPWRNGFRYIFARPLDEWFAFAYHREEVLELITKANLSGGSNTS
jgi:hypothetical protein